MNSKKNKSGSLTRVPLTFLSVMAMLLLALGWLGWLLLDQDRKLQQQRDQARIDIAAETLSLALMARINEEFSQLKSQTMPLQELPGVGVRFSKGSMEVIPEKGLLYSPLQKPSEAPHESLFRADRLEFQQGKPAELLSLLEQLASSPDPALQAAAHMRLGRIANRSGNAEQALSEYARLAEFEGQLIEGAPAQWLASYARCRIFLAQGSQDNFLIELSKLSALLASGGSGVAKSTYLFYAGEVNRWVNDTAAIQPKVILPDSHAVSDSVESLYLIRTEQVQGRGRPEGLQIAGQGAESLLMMWYSDDREMLGRVIRIDDLLDSGFFGEIQELQLQGLGWSISDAEGRRILISDMEPVSDVSSVSLAIGDSSISVQAYATAGMVPIAEDVQRRQLLFAGLAVVLILILTSTYSISRALRREAETAALQADFVSAVSHEFRTPLTSIRQLLEMLSSGRVQDKDKIIDYYRILEKESARLQRLVEDLLDFRRMESNARPYRPESFPVEGLIEEISASFSEEHGLDAAALQTHVEGNAMVYLDRESLTRAIWNLLDNSVKYSKGKPRIALSSSVRGSNVQIEVKDQGVGIEMEDQSRIFNKFVRGDAAKITNAKGTGLGLAMVRKVLEDQGGSIHVQSTPGGGSTFTMVLELAGKI